MYVYIYVYIYIFIHCINHSGPSWGCSIGCFLFVQVSLSWDASLSWPPLKNKYVRWDLPGGPSGDTKPKAAPVWEHSGIRAPSDVAAHRQ